MEKNIFELATRQALRFPSLKGMLSVEDLWNLPLSTTVANKVSLDNVAQGIYAEMNSGSNVSFVSGAKTDKTLELKLDILKHIIAVIEAANAAKLAEMSKANMRELIREQLAKREQGDLEGKSKAELLAMLDTMN